MSADSVPGASAMASSIAWVRAYVALAKYTTTAIPILWSTAIVALLLSVGKLAPAVFRDGLQLIMTRGRLWETRPKVGLGFLSNWSVPQRWTASMLLIGALIEAVILGLHLIRLQPIDDQVVLMFLHLIFVCCAWYDARYVMVYPKGARMHALVWILGIAFYALVPFSFMTEPSINSMIAQYVGMVEHSSWPSFMIGLNKLMSVLSGSQGGPVSALMSALQTPAAKLGFAVYLYGLVLFTWSHSAIRSHARETAAEKAMSAAWSPRAGPSSELSGEEKPLMGADEKAQARERHRREEAAAVKDSATHGGLFDLVSCPHHLAEVLVYVGLALMASHYGCYAQMMCTFVVLDLLFLSNATRLTCSDEFPKQRMSEFPWGW